MTKLVRATSQMARVFDSVAILHGCKSDIHVANALHCVVAAIVVSVDGYINGLEAYLSVNK